MAFSTFMAQGDAVGDGGAVEVQIKRDDCDDESGLSPLVRVYLMGEHHENAHAGGHFITLPAKKLDVFAQAVRLAIAEGRRTGVLPPGS